MSFCRWRQNQGYRRGFRFLYREPNCLPQTKIKKLGFNKESSYCRGSGNRTISCPQTFQKQWKLCFFIKKSLGVFFAVTDANLIGNTYFFGPSNVYNDPGWGTHEYNQLLMVSLSTFHWLCLCYSINAKHMILTETDKLFTIGSLTNQREFFWEI